MVFLSARACALAPRGPRATAEVRVWWLDTGEPAAAIDQAHGAGIFSLLAFNGFVLSGSRDRGIKVPARGQSARGCRRLKDMTSREDFIPF